MTLELPVMTVLSRTSPPTATLPWPLAVVVDVLGVSSASGVSALMSRLHWPRVDHRTLALRDHGCSRPVGRSDRPDPDAVPPISAQSGRGSRRPRGPADGGYGLGPRLQALGSPGSAGGRQAVGSRGRDRPRLAADRRRRSGGAARSDQEVAG